MLTARRGASRQAHGIAVESKRNQLARHGMRIVNVTPQTAHHDDQHEGAAGEEPALCATRDTRHSAADPALHHRDSRRHVVQ